MSVFQVEQYYIFTSTKNATNTQLEEINQYLEDEGIDDFEHQDGDIVVDGFESEQDANICEEKIKEILAK